MAHPVTWFQISGPDGDSLVQFYSNVFQYLAIDNFHSLQLGQLVYCHSIFAKILAHHTGDVFIFKWKNPIRPVY